MIATGILLLQHTATLAAPIQLSLQESINLALKNNPAMGIAAVDKEKSAYSLTEARAGQLPSVSLGSSYNVRDISQSSLDDGSFSNSVRLSLPLYTGGRVEGQISQAKYNTTIADLNVLKAKQQMILDATTGYYSVLQAANMVAVNQQTVDSLREHLKTVQAKYDAGVVAKSDVLRSEVELANAEQNLSKVQNSHDVAESSLRSIMNIDANTAIQLKDELHYEQYGKTLDESLAQAHSNRPDIAQADIGVKIAAEGIGIAASGKLPSVSMSASSGWDDSLVPQDNNWSVGISASWNIFDAGVTNAKVKSAEQSVDKAKLQAEQIQDSAEQEVRQSYLNMQEAEKRLQTTNVATEKASEDLNIAREKYNAGVGTNLDVIDAQLALTQAKTNHIQALYDYEVNKAKLEKAAGLTARQ